MKVLPRPPPATLADRELLRTPWDFYKSIFKDYKADNQKLLDDCFEIDWSQTKCEEKVIKGEGEVPKTKAIMKKYYQMIRETYKYYAGVSPLGRIMCIGTGVLTEIMSYCNNFIDKETFMLNDVDFNVIACNGGMKATKLNPEKALVRCQMLEVIVRMSIDKFVKSGIVKTVSEAVQMSMEKHFAPFFETFNCHEFRTKKLWQEEMDVLFTRWLPGLEALYKKNCIKLAMPGVAKTPMCLDEFVDIFMVAGLVDDTFGLRQIGPDFNLSMQTVKDELKVETHLNMFFVEFLECLARCADKFKMGNLVDHFPDYKSRNPYELDKKTECLIVVLLEKHLPPKQFEAIYKKYKETVEAELKNPKATKFAKRN